MAVPEAEHADVALAVERDVVRKLRRVLEVGTDAIEAAGEAVRYLSLDVTVDDIDFRAERHADAGRAFREMDAHGAPDAVQLSKLYCWRYSRGVRLYRERNTRPKCVALLKP